MVDWDAGSYEQTAAELEPVAEAVIAQAGLSPGDDVLDLACGTGNAALLAAGRGARVTGIDSAVRLLGVARRRAQVTGLQIDFRPGDLLELPVPDASADAVLSIFGVIFAPEPERALAEISRVLRTGGRALISAWIPAGPLDAMLSEVGQVVGRLMPSAPPRRFAWADPDALGPVAAAAGLRLRSTTPGELAIRAASPEAYVADSREHPMALATMPLIEQAGAGAELADRMIRALRDGNEDPEAMLIRSPYVIHELVAHTG
jgi:SAM-dependent methyltransferase